MTEWTLWLWPGASYALPQGPMVFWFGFTLLLWCCAALYSMQTIQSRKRLYWISFVLAMLGNLQLLLAQDVLGFYLGFALMSLSAYGLVIHRGDKTARQAGRLYLQLAILGELLLFAGLLLRVDAAEGALLIANLQSIELTPLTLTLLLLGLGLKAGFFPLHIWLPLAHPAAPVPASAVLSGAMIKAGLLGLWQFLPAQDPLLVSWLPGLALLALGSALFGALIALLHQSSKVVLAYSSVSQMGYMLLALVLYWASPLELQTAATWLLVGYCCHHALLKSALFLAAGSVNHYRLSTWHGALLLWPLLSLVALPLSSGAMVKYGLKQGVSESSLPALPLLDALLAFGALCTALLALHWLRLAKAQWQLPGPSLPGTASLAWGILVLASLSMPGWFAALRPQWLASLSFSAVLAALWPVALALLLHWGWQRSGWQLAAAWQQPRSPALGWSLWLKAGYQSRSRALPVLRLPAWRQSERWLNRRLATESLLPGVCALLFSLLLLLWLLSA